MWNIKIGIVGKAVPKQNTLSSLAIIATWAKTEKFFTNSKLYKIIKL